MAKAAVPRLQIRQNIVASGRHEADVLQNGLSPGGNPSSNTEEPHGQDCGECMAVDGADGKTYPRMLLSYRCCLRCRLEG